MAKQDGDNNRKGGDTQVGLTLRIVVALYVLYLAYGLIQGYGETSGNDRIFIAIAIIIFIAAGGAILFFSGRKLIRKEYVDASQDIEDDVVGESAEAGEEKE
ncbi:MAG: hypothetical protein HDR16_04965 [Lachnospiraceae bacterium]|nr:hypothetical protein [Lachnospiraceae bacterium]